VDVKLGTMVPVALAVGSLAAAGLVLTGHTAWIPSLAATDLLASRTTCITLGVRQLDERSVLANGRWSRRTDQGTVATGTVRSRDRKALEVAARKSPPPRSSTGPTCSDPSGYTITYRWRYDGRDVAVTQNMYAATPLPIEVELDRLATKLD
jgi:hypothetical protein